MTLADRPALPKTAEDWVIENPDAAADLIRQGRDAQAAQPLPMVQWQDIPQPPPQPWVIPDWLPSGALTLLSGPGGTGKSRLALQLAAGIAGGAADWMTGANTHGLALDDRLHGGGAVVYASWEDRPAVIARQLAGLSGPTRTHVTPDMALFLPGNDVHGIADAGPLYAAGAYQTTEHTHLARRLQAAAVAVDAALVVLDSLAAIYAASEIDRAAVRGFLSSWDTWAYEHDCAVLMLAHPPKSGMDYSGSTDWLAGVRALWTLTKEPYGPPPSRNSEDSRFLGWKLACAKSNYADKGPPAAVRLDWQGPALAAVGPWEDKADSEEKTYDPTI